MRHTPNTRPGDYRESIAFWLALAADARRRGRFSECKRMALLARQAGHMLRDIG